MTKTRNIKRQIAALIAAAGATAAFAGFGHTAQLPTATPAAHHAQATSRCRHETIKNVRYSECESRTGDKVTYTYTQVTTWTVR